MVYRGQLIGKYVKDGLDQLTDALYEGLDYASSYLIGNRENWNCL